MKFEQRRQQGFAAVAAIFLVVLLAALGAFMVSFSNTQHLNSARDLQGSRAYWAARAGLEWGIVAIPANPTLCPNVTATQVAAASIPSPLDGFSITIMCSKNTYAEQSATSGLATVTIYRIDAQASAGTAGSVSYVERSISISLEQ